MKSSLRVFVLGALVLAMGGCPNGPLNPPATATTGRIYATSYRSSRVSQMDDMLGTGWASLGGEGTGTGQFHFPLGIFHR